MAETFDLAKRAGRIEVRLTGQRLGNDLQLAIVGGDRPHIGAVALSFRHPALKNPQIEDVTTSVIAVTGHKEDLLARTVAQRIAAGTGRTTSVSCGIHLDGISKAEIQSVQELVEALVDEFIARNGAF
jgi:hypothetical protein